MLELKKQIGKLVSDDMYSKLYKKYESVQNLSYQIILDYIKHVYLNEEDDLGSFEEVYPSNIVPAALLKSAFSDIQEYSNELIERYYNEFPNIIFDDYMDTLDWVQCEIEKLWVVKRLIFGLVFFYIYYDIFLTIIFIKEEVNSYD